MTQTVKIQRVRPYLGAEPGEVWWTNVIEKDPSFDEIFGQWQTARLGQTAYDCHGRVIQASQLWGSIFPVFVQREELERAGYTIEDPAT